MFGIYAYYGKYGVAGWDRLKTLLTCLMLLFIVAFAPLDSWYVFNLVAGLGILLALEWLIVEDDNGK